MIAANSKQNISDPSDLSNRTIERLFYTQMKNLTLRCADHNYNKDNTNCKLRTFDIQFSDAWI